VFITVDSLEYLQKGGRIGKLSAFAGTLLQIKPIIVQKEGELHPEAKVRGRQKALDRILNMLCEYVGDRKDDYDYVLMHADCYKELELIEQKMKEMGFHLELPIQDLGVTIGSHTGPTLIGLAPILKYNVQE
jgi:DegV family protein with EDD domain